MKTGMFLATLLLFASVSQGFADSEVACRDLGCYRETSTYSLGFNYDISDLLEVDVGKCVAGTDDHEELQQVHSDTEVQLFPPSPLPPACACSPIEYTHSIALTRTGPVDVQSISACHTSMPSVCHRQDSYHHFHSNTSYHTVVDLGSCTGKCGNTSCVPISTTSIAVEGPNGFSTFDKVTECGCRKQKCYRQDYYQLIHALQMTENGTVTMEERAVNVGVCVGGCEGVWIPGDCFPSPTLCLIKSNPVKALCVPHHINTVDYTDRDGVERSVSIIGSCACGRQ